MCAAPRLMPSSRAAPSFPPLRHAFCKREMFSDVHDTRLLCPGAGIGALASRAPLHLDDASTMDIKAMRPRFGSQRPSSMRCSQNSSLFRYVASPLVSLYLAKTESRLVTLTKRPFRVMLRVLSTKV